MEQKKLEEFNIELKALLTKFNCSLTIGQQIHVLDNKVEVPVTITPLVEIGEVTTSEEVK